MRQNESMLVSDAGFQCVLHSVSFVIVLRSVLARTPCRLRRLAFKSTAVLLPPQINTAMRSLARRLAADVSAASAAARRLGDDPQRFPQFRCASRMRRRYQHVALTWR